MTIDGVSVQLQDIIVFDVSTPVRGILRASEQTANWFASFEWHILARDELLWKAALNIPKILSTLDGSETDDQTPRDGHESRN